MSDNSKGCPGAKHCIHARNAVGLKKLIQRFEFNKMKEADLKDYGQDVALLQSMILEIMSPGTGKGKNE